MSDQEKYLQEHEARMAKADQVIESARRINVEMQAFFAAGLDISARRSGYTDEEPQAEDEKVQEGR